MKISFKHVYEGQEGFYHPEFFFPCLILTGLSGFLTLSFNDQKANAILGNGIEFVLIYFCVCV